MLRQRRRAPDREHRAALLEERAQLRQRRRARVRADARAVLLGNVLGSRRARRERAGARLGNRAVGQDQDVVLRPQLSGVELRRVDDLVTGTRTARARAASIPTASTRRSDPTGRCARAAALPGRRAGRSTPSKVTPVLAAILVSRARVARVPATRKRPSGSHSTRSPAFSSRLIARNASLVACAKTNAVAPWRAGDAPGGHAEFVGHALERPVEGLEDAVELHAHLEGERPAGAVVGRNRRAARVLEVVRMILRLEHVEHVRAKCLRRLHDERAGRVRRPCTVNGAVAR